MSENDILQEADGKNEVESQETTPKQEITSPIENEVEATVENNEVATEVETNEVETEVKAESEESVKTEDVEVEAKIDTTVEAVVETKQVKVDAKSEAKPKDDHVDEIEASNAEDAEDESNAERHELEDKDYHAMTMDELSTEFNTLLKHHKIQTISKHVNEIKAEFNAKFSALIKGVELSDLDRARRASK